jgi:hypothetical protein
MIQKLQYFDVTELPASLHLKWGMGLKSVTLCERYKRRRMSLFSFCHDTTWFSFRWILKDQSWGGAIELSILSQYYGIQIAAYDIRTKRCDVYGVEAGQDENNALLYKRLCIAKSLYLCPLYSCC